MSWAAALAKLASAISNWEFSLLRLEKPVFHIVTGGKVGSIGTSGKARRARPSKSKGKASSPINLSLLSLEQKQQLQKALRDALDSGQSFILDETPKMLESIRESGSSQKNVELMRALQPYLSAADSAALRASLVLCDTRERGDGALRKQMKSDIVKKFGERGAKISNLCSAGYFDAVVKRLKVLRGNPSFNADAYRKNLDEFIAQSAFALFVQDRWSRLDTSKAILDRIRVNARYGIKKIVIHALGEENIDKVQSIVEAIGRKYHEIDKTFEAVADGEVRIKLEFPSSIARKLDKNE